MTFRFQHMAFRRFPFDFCLFNIFFIRHLHPCDENRVKIDDFIAIFGPINRAIYHDRSWFRHKSVVNRDLIDDFFLENCDKIVRADDFFWGWGYNHEKWQDFDKIDYLTSYDITLSISSKSRKNGWFYRDFRAD
jgi:hypothetical protein